MIMLDSSAVAFQLILAVVEWGKRPEGLSQVCGRDGLADRRQSFEDDEATVLAIRRGRAKTDGDGCSSTSEKEQGNRREACESEE